MTNVKHDTILKNTQKVKDIERLIKYMAEGFFTSPNGREIKIVEDFHHGSGIEGSVNKEMWNAVKLGERAFEAVMIQAAADCIKRLEEELSD